MVDAEQPNATLAILTRLARWSSVIGLVAVLGYVGAYLFVEQGQLLVLAGVVAAVIVLWSQTPRLALRDPELGVWGYSAGVFLIALALALLTHGAAVALLLVLPVLVNTLLLGRLANPGITLAAFITLVALAFADALVPWPRADYAGYFPIAQHVVEAVLLAGIGLLAAHVARHQHSLAGDSSAWSEKLEALNRRVEQLITERAQALQLGAEIMHLAINANDEGSLLEGVAGLLLERYRLSHAKVYMIGADEIYAELRVTASRRATVRTGATASVRVGSDSPVGQALEQGEAMVRSKPMLPGDRHVHTELAVPMHFNDRLIGVLDLQHAEEEGFSEEEVNLFPLIANQVACAIALARRRREDTMGVGRRPSVDLRAVPKTTQTGKESLVQAIEEVELPSGGPVTQDDMLLAPIALRGEVVGTLGFRDEQLRELSPDDLDLIRAVADQVAQAVENLDLLEGTERAALREQLVNEITAELQRSTSVDDVLKTAAQALQRVLGGYDVTIRLTSEALGVSRLEALDKLPDSDESLRDREES